MPIEHPDCQQPGQFPKHAELDAGGARDRTKARKVLQRMIRSTVDASSSIHVATQKAPWNKGKLVGQKAPLRLKDIWAIRVRLQIGHRTRGLALFNHRHQAAIVRFGEVAREGRMSMEMSSRRAP